MKSKTIARQGRKKFDGKLYLDSKSLTFKGKEFRWSAQLGDSISAKVRDNLVVVQDGAETVSFEIGEEGEKWVEKILNPPNRIKKLGVKPDDRCWLSGQFDAAFKGELRQHGARTTRKIESCDIAFWHVTRREQLIELTDIADALPDGVNLWVIWTKGSKGIGQADVMSAAKSVAMGPSKRAAFDDDHSSMRFARKK